MPVRQKEIVAAVNPKPAAKPTIRKKPVRSLGAAKATDDRAEVPESSSEEEPRPERGKGTLAVVWRDFYNIKFSAGKSLREKLERFAEVLGIDNAERNMAEIFEWALDLALEKKDPQRKLERRRKREAAAARRTTGSAGVPPASSGVSPTGSAGVSPASSPEKVSTEEMKPPERTVRRAAHAAGSRYIPSSVRERVLERACYQCEFTGTGGVIQSSRILSPRFRSCRAASSAPTRFPLTFQWVS